MADPTPPPVIPDPVRLAHEAYRPMEARVADWRMVFGSDAGRRVLVDILGMSGAFTREGALEGAERHYQAGRRDLALSISEGAGYDPAAVAIASLTGKLEGKDHDRPNDSGRWDTGRTIVDGEQLVDDDDLPG